MRQPTTRQLRQFGVSGAVALPLLAWVAMGRPLGDWQPSQVGWVLGVAALGLALAVASWRGLSAARAVYVTLTWIAWPIGWVVNEALLLAVFALVFTPVAILFRLIGRDALGLKLDRSSASYWTSCRQPTEVESYFRQS